MKQKLISLFKPTIERFPRLAITYRFVRDHWQSHDEPQKTPMGFLLVGNKSMQKGEFEPEETNIVSQIVTSVDEVINIGANIGYYCCIALSRGKKVIAFEPINQNLRYLLRNIKANKWESSIEIFPVALSNKTGVIEIYGGGTGASLLKGWAGTPEQDVNLVPCSTLDKILGPRTGGVQYFIIVDIEGAEQFMLEGARSVLEMEPRPIWMVEISVSEHQPKGVQLNPNLQSTFRIFRDNGYEAYTADRECRAIHEEEIETIVKTGKDSLHTHNFLFIEKGKISEFINDPEGLMKKD